MVGGASYDISFGTPIGTFPVGSIVSLRVNGVAKEFIVVHQGLPSSMYDGSCDGTWLLMKDAYEKRIWNDRYSTYAYSMIHTYLNNTFINLFDANVIGAIKQAKIPYCAGGGSSVIYSGSSGLPAKIFLLSGYELGWVTSDHFFPADGAKLAYFSSGTSESANSKRTATLDGAPVEWWTRSPNTNSDVQVYLSNRNGAFGARDCKDEGNVAVRPAMILPSDFKV